MLYMHTHESCGRICKQKLMKQDKKMELVGAIKDKKVVWGK